MKTRTRRQKVHRQRRSLILILGAILAVTAGLALSLLQGTPSEAASSIDFTQCQNDSDNNNVKDDCTWTTGALNAIN